MKMRSWLCVNLLREDHLLKTHELSADITHLDLEDGIPLDKKAAAREALKKVNEHTFEQPTALRINSLSTTDGLRDLILLADHQWVPNIIILPKARLPEDVDMAYRVLKSIRPDVKIFAVVETPKTLLSLTQMSVKPEGLSGVIFGSADFAAELRVDLEQTDFSWLRRQIVIAARNLDLICIDSPCFTLGGENVLRNELDFARSLGFDGKIAIHPSQVNTINEVLNPTHEQLVQAQNLVSHFTTENQQAILKHNDSMKGPPFLKQARFLLSKA